MRKLFMAVVQILVLAGGSRMSAADDSLERLLRAQAFNREFEGFDSYNQGSRRISLSLTDHMKCWRWPVGNFLTIPNV